MNNTVISNEHNLIWDIALFLGIERVLFIFYQYRFIREKIAYGAVV